ncbi:uncharacterized protein LOC126784293 [Argentina anserina]|uniref:uncharacterized protein LOC126784293 n=1 Tax=Argentina anserina TaxID=57926 RepID=UPI00217642E0|nr:uncharacterized protein LOC126784293 [Potentilla anserina]
MGYCISKSNPKSQFQVAADDQFCNNATTLIPSHHSNKISQFPSSPSHSSSSASLSSSSSTLSSSASSVSSSSNIERSFSNEFLWFCYKGNPHISRIALIKEAQKPVSAATLRKQEQPSPINRGNGNAKTTPQKRVRTSTSPTLKRQKSFRKKLEIPVISACPRSLRSPSLSRRFNSPARDTQTRIHRISSKIDEVAVREALAQDHYMESVPEDIDNPLISLDFFYFLVEKLTSSVVENRKGFI